MDPSNRLYSKRFLGSVFNEHVALMMIFSGVILPFSLAESILRVLIDANPEEFEEYKLNIPEMCYSIQQYYNTWMSPCYYMSIVAIIYRFVLVKYADHGLVNDRYYYNMNQTLFKALYWISNIFLFVLNQGVTLSNHFKHGNPFRNTYRSLACTRTEESEDLKNSHKLYEVRVRTRINYIFDISKHQNPDSIRNGNLLMKSCALMFALCIVAGIHWKKRQMPPGSFGVRGNRNVVTLNMTFLLVILIYLDHAVLAYFIGPINQHFFFPMEMTRTIIIENVLLRFIIPLYVLIDSKTKLPSLWSERDEKRLGFLMKMSKIEARPPVSKFGGEIRNAEKNQEEQNNDSVNLIDPGKKKCFVSIHMTEHQTSCESLPSVECRNHPLL